MSSELPSAALRLPPTCPYFSPIPMQATGYSAPAPTSPTDASQQQEQHSSDDQSMLASPVKPSPAEPVFYQGIIGSSNHDIVYIRAQHPASPTSPAFKNDSTSDTWVTVPWPALTKELLSQEGVMHALIDQLRQPEHSHQRTLLMRAFSNPLGHASAVRLGPFGPSGSLAGTRFPPMPMPSPPAPDFRVDSPLFSSLPDEMNLWHSHRESIDSSPFSAMPDTPVTPSFPNDDYYSISPPAVRPAPALFSTSSSGNGNGSNTGSHAQQAGPQVLTAGQDVIDPAIAEERLTNPHTAEFVWSHTECALYGVDSLRAPGALQQPDAVKLVFPPGTMIMAKEKDGAIASPAYTLTHPNSNEWLKAQVCHKQCAYRAGTTSLKRPKTVREHFQKCVWLDAGHPLKVLSSLQLAVLERESQGLLPRHRRGRVSIPLSRLQPYRNVRSLSGSSSSGGSGGGSTPQPGVGAPASQSQSQSSTPAPYQHQHQHQHGDVFKNPGQQQHPSAQRHGYGYGHGHLRLQHHEYGSSPETESVKYLPGNNNVLFGGGALRLVQGSRSVHTSPSQSSLSEFSSFEASPRMR